MHNAAFAALGLDWAYVPLPVRADDLGVAVAGLRALGFRGANVTVPHKTSIVRYLDASFGEARVVNAVNTLVFGPAGAVGHNTDVAGFSLALRECTGEPFAGAAAVLLGAGGAARAVALALAGLGFSDLVVANRSRGPAEELRALLEVAAPGLQITLLSPDELSPRHVLAARLVVNATVLGMGGAGKVPAALTDNVGEGQIAYDVAYASGPTEFLRAAAARGARVVDGRAMLVRQAAVAFELWTGRPAPVDVMRDAIDGRHLHRGTG
jgi:shikimate dehydrogenase